MSLYLRFPHPFQFYILCKFYFLTFSYQKSNQKQTFSCSKHHLNIFEKLLQTKVKKVTFFQKAFVTL